MIYTFFGLQDGGGGGGGGGGVGGSPFPKFNFGNREYTNRLASHFKVSELHISRF
jgi:hypothetical protein